MSQSVTESGRDPERKKRDQNIVVTGPARLTAEEEAYQQIDKKVAEMEVVYSSSKSITYGDIPASFWSRPAALTGSSSTGALSGKNYIPVILHADTTISKIGVTVTILGSTTNNNYQFAVFTDKNGFPDIAVYYSATINAGTVTLGFNTIDVDTKFKAGKYWFCFGRVSTGTVTAATWRRRDYASSFEGWAGFTESAAPTSSSIGIYEGPGDIESPFDPTRINGVDMSLTSSNAPEIWVAT